MITTVGAATIANKKAEENFPSPDSSCFALHPVKGSKSGSVSRTINNTFSEKLVIFPENLPICQGKFG